MLKNELVSSEGSEAHRLVMSLWGEGRREEEGCSRRTARLSQTSSSKAEEEEEERTNFDVVGQPVERD